MSYALLCDLGNTALKIGLAVNGRLMSSGSLSDFAHAGWSPQQAVARFAGDHQQVADRPGICLAASVVPTRDELLKEAVKKHFGCDTLFLGADFEVPLVNGYERPRELGADRLAAAYGARVFMPQLRSLIVVDFGTAITFDCIVGNVYRGGMIFPGPASALAALSERAELLPRISFDAGAAMPAPGRTTETCMRNGLVYGYAGLTQSLCNLLRMQMQEPCGIIATGGYAGVIASVCRIFDSIRPALVLEGLAALCRQ